MSEIGKAVRMGQILNPETGKLVVVAMDHCPAIGPCPGMIDPMSLTPIDRLTTDSAASPSGASTQMPRAK